MDGAALAALEFPRIVYFGPQTPPDYVYRRVDTVDACLQALAEGYTLVPRFAGDPEPTVPDPAPAPPVAPEPEKRRPGRPRKVMP